MRVILIVKVLTDFWPMFTFYTPWKYQRTNLLKILFSHFFAVPQKAFLKLFEAPQKSVKIKI